MARAKYFFSFLFIQVVLQFSNGSSNDKFFRDDYEYFEETQSFYKIHTLSKTWDNAKRTCMLEGARLWYPKDKCEADAVLCHLNETKPEFNSIHVGISSKIAKGVFKTIDGVSLTHVYNNWKQGEPNDYGGQEDCVILQNRGTYNDVSCNFTLPFICKKTLASVNWDDKCNVPYSDYQYSEELGKCYKFHSTPLYWRDAYVACDIEQSYLSIINSKAEAEYLQTLTNKSPQKPGAVAGQIHVGFSYDAAYDSWTTISGDSLQDSEYSAWAFGKPDGGEAERCGSMFLSDLTFNDIGCEAHKCYFICEREHENFKQPKKEC